MMKQKGMKNPKHIMIFFNERKNEIVTWELCNVSTVFAPVVKQTTFRLFLTILGIDKMFVEHFDVKTAYLNGDFSEEICMDQPEEFKEQGKEELECKLNKSIYGLEQLARALNIKLNESIEDLVSKGNCR